MPGGYVLAFSSCVCCRNVFSYNPKKVPSTSAVTGTREPVCEKCMSYINRKRVTLGIPPLVVHPDAYEPLPEEEL